MNNLLDEFFASVFDATSYSQFITRFKIVEQSEVYRHEIRQLLNNNDIVKARNLAWGDISYRNPVTDKIEVIPPLA